MMSVRKWTYSARIVAEWLEARRIQHSPNVNATRSLATNGCNHAIRIAFRLPPGLTKQLYLAVQTHPAVVGDAFAETSLHTDKEVIRICTDLAYSGPPKRHTTPSALFTHLAQLLQLLGAPDTYASAVQQNSGNYTLDSDDDCA